MKIYQTVAVCAFAIEGDPFSARGISRRSAPYEPKPRSYSMRKEMITAQLKGRNITGYFYYHFHDYGCYCIAQNKETNPLKNHGRPLDEVDSVCQAHSKCQQCVYADGFANFNPKSTGYQMTIDSSNGDITCNGRDDYPKNYRENGSWESRYNACLCDRELAVGLADMAKLGYHNAEYKNHDGTKCGSTKNGGTVVTGKNGGSPTNGGSNVYYDAPGIDLQLLGAHDIYNETLTDANGTLPDGNETRTLGEGMDVFVSENVGECCGKYPNRAPVPHTGSLVCCKATNELRPLGGCI